MGFSGSQKKILIVDDELDLTSMFKMVLEMNGFEVKQSFPELDEKKCFVRKPKAIEDLVKHLATILG